jgi:hypothetical protein
LRQKYRTSESFQSICQNYQKCTEALKHWPNPKVRKRLIGIEDYLEIVYMCMGGIKETA